MNRTLQVLMATAVASFAVLAGCAGRPAMQSIPTLELDSGSLRLSLALDRNGTINLAEHAPLRGRIEVAPILDAEGHEEAETVQVILHGGRYYIMAEGFRNIWELVPRVGTTRATYRSIAVSATPLSGVRMSRYGPEGRACVRLDVDGAGPWFVTGKGELHDRCG